MYIERIKIDMLTEKENKYGVDLSLLNDDGTRKKINLIYGENTLGKSTLIKSIIYCLGGEEIYGKSRDDRPNFPIVMRVINDEKVIKNEISLQLMNKGKRIVIVRDALHRDESVKVYESVAMDEIKDGNIPRYLKQKKVRDVEAVDLFQEYMFEFMGFPYLMNDESGLALLYIQNLLPLFVIPQHGWADIQSCNPYYSVQGVKQKAFEIIMGFSSIKAIEEKIQLSQLKNQKREKQLEQSKILENIELYKTKDIDDNEEESKQLLDSLDKLQNQKDEMDKQKVGSNRITKPIKDKYRMLSKVLQKYESKKAILQKEINEFSSYINNLELEILKLDKLNNAKKLISSLPVKQCPHCFNSVSLSPIDEIQNDYCFLCGKELDKRKESENQEIYRYLKDEKKDFLRFVEMKNMELKKVNSTIKVLKLDIKEMKSMIDDVDLKLNPDFLNKYHIVSRQIGKLRSELTSIEKERIVLEKLNKVEKELTKLDKDIKAKVKYIKSIESAESDKLKFQKFEEYFKVILSDLDFIKDGFDDKKLDVAEKKYFNKIYIDKDSYYPKIDNQNLYNITSSSGFIRIILSYYLALMKTSFEFKSMNYPGLMIIDEPKQQNLDNATFTRFTDYLTDFKENEGIQIVFASGNKGSLTDEDLLVHLDEYLIRKLN